MGGEVYGNGRQKNQILRQEIRCPVLNFVSDRMQPTAGASAQGSALACRQSADSVYIKSDVVYTLEMVDL